MTDGCARRAVLIGAAGGLGVLALGCDSKAVAEKVSVEEPPAPPTADVTPTEDLMREHGVLERLTLVYEEWIRQLSAPGGRAPSPDTLVAAAGLMRRFVEDYHAKLEEDYVFSRFEKHGTFVELVQTLRQQHDTSRRITSQITAIASSGGRGADARTVLSQGVASFSRMMRPHAAREDTVLFPAFRKIVPVKEFDELGDRFEDQERKFFGSRGFESIVEQVLELERQLDIADISSATPT
jgi:hemerythrin-like domain-containing protein